MVKLFEWTAPYVSTVQSKNSEEHRQIEIHWLLTQPFRLYRYSLAEFETWQIKRNSLCLVYHHVHGGRNAVRYRSLPLCLIAGYRRYD